MTVAKNYLYMKQSTAAPPLKLQDNPLSYLLHLHPLPVKVEQRPGCGSMVSAEMVCCCGSRASAGRTSYWSTVGALAMSQMK